MNIVYVTETYPPEVNGVALTVERTVRHLREHRHAVTLVRPAQRGESRSDTAQEFLCGGLPIPVYPDLQLGLAASGVLAAMMRRRHAQLVHVATQGPLGRAAVIAARRLGLPVSTDFRTDFEAYSRHYRLGWLAPLVLRYLRRFHRRADATFVPTAALKRRLDACGFERVSVLGRGVDAALFAPARRSEALRAAWGAAPDQPVAIYVGRLAKEKNVALAAEAFAAAKKAVPAARFVMVGDGPLRGALQAEWPDVIFAGVQRGEALAEHYASADCFLFPSLSDTFGNVVPEAMASGLAVVAFDTAAAGELIVDGREGHVVRPGDRPAFVEAARRAVSSCAPGSAMRQAARRAALQVEWNTVLRTFEQRLSRLVAGRPADESAAKAETMPAESTRPPARV